MTQEGRQSIQAFLDEVRAKIPVPVIWESGDHVASRLLTPEENTRVIKILSKKRKALATTVAQVWFAYPKEENAWKVNFTGVLCFVKDSIMKSHFIRLLDIDKADENDGVMWEQEIYRKFRYKAVKDNFHTFEGDYCNIGLNFCDVEEASYFHQCIKERIAFFRKLRASIKAKREMRNTKIGGNPAVKDIITSVRVRHGIHVTAQKLKSKHDSRKQSQDGATESTCTTTNIASNSEEGNISLMQFSGKEDLKKSTRTDPLKNGGCKNKDYLAVTTFNNKNRPEIVSSWSSSVIDQSSGWDMSQITGQNSSSNRSQATENSGSPERSNDKRRSTLPLTKQVLHPIARRNQLLLNNNKVAMKIKEQQREYHSSMIKSLVMGRDAKTKRNEFTKVVDAAVKKNQSTRGGDDASKSTEVKPKNRSKALQHPVPQIAVENKTTEASIIVPGVQKDPHVSSVPREDLGPGLPSEHWVPNVAWGIQNDPVALSVPREDSGAGLPPDEWESNFSFPSLPSMDKLELSSSLTFGNIASEKASDAALNAGDLEGIEVVHASSEETAQQSNAIAAVPVLDTRDELMKSIIAGKKLNKVNPESKSNSNMRRPAISNACAIIDMVGCLTKALEGRNKALRDSSSDDDDYDIDDDYEWEDVNEEWD